METQVQTPRRFRILDAIVLIAVTAAAIPPTKVLLPEVIPVFQKLNTARLFDETYFPQLFHHNVRSGRMESIHIQLRRIRDPVMSSVKPRVRAIDRTTGQRVSAEKALEDWVSTHVGRGAPGFAIAQDSYFLVFPFLILWALGLVVLRLVRPRPGISALFRQPGWWASLGSLLGVVLAIAAEAVIEFPAPSGIVPVTVMVAWIVLAATRKWQAEASWIDRAGRLLGVLWIATVPIYLIGFVWSWLK